MMKLINKKIKSKRSHLLMMVAFALTSSVMLNSCEENILPEEGSIPDLTPPAADYTYVAFTENYKEVIFSNLSSSATMYEWNFDDGSTSSDENPRHEFAVDGTYEVTLTATDNHGVSSDTSQLILIEKPARILYQFINGSMEDSTTANGNRDNWWSSALNNSADELWGNGSWLPQASGGESNNSTPGGTFSLKLPTGASELSDRRWLYQSIRVEPETNYIIKFSLKMRSFSGAATADDNIILVDIYNGPFEDAAILGDKTYIINDTPDNDPYSFSGGPHNTHKGYQLTFNSGIYTEIAFVMHNEWNTAEYPDSDDTWIDDIEIEFADELEE
ncbi:MAG: PKD domain-containing protein [Reichenbachiella sp.]